MPDVQLVMSTTQHIHSLGPPCSLVSQKHPSCDNNDVPDLETAYYHHAVTVSQ